MKVQVLQENLQRGLSVVGRAVATRSTLPITANVLVQTDNGRLKLAATDLDIAISAWVGAKVDAEGATTVPARLITDFVSSLPSETTVSLEIPDRGRQVKLECARNDATINAMDAEDFPRIATVTGGIAFELDPKSLKRAIDLVEFAAANDDSRPVLTGVQFKSDGPKLTLAAADGFRLAVANLELAAPPADAIEVVVPARALRELSRLMGDSTEGVEMRVNAQKTQVQFALTDIELVAQLIQGTFPNYNQLIPQNNTTTMSVALDEFRREARIAAIFARDGSGIIRLQISSGQLMVSARADEVGNHEGIIDANLTGEASKIAFNSRYLGDVLQALGTDRVSLEMSSPSSQGVFKPEGPTEPGETGYVHVVMPMFVQW